ncbi:MAG: alpha-amylase family glycosyl hydrolase [Pseudomonadota bacterium]
MPNQQGPRIYNLFPRLAGKFSAWQPHLKRAAGMKFNWIFLNPIHYSGFSGSMYSIKEYYGYDPALIDDKSKVPAEEQLKKTLTQGRGLGLEFMVDLIINHTASDSPLVAEHHSWYGRDEWGNIRHPGAWDNGNWVTWGDLSEVDNANSPDRAALWAYWDSLIAHYQRLGVTGFRCDAAYQIPADCWRYLTQRAKERGRAVFFAETLGCKPEETLSTARAGFDYIFNSFKWWNLWEPWFLDQYRQTAGVTPSVAFPESHDTERLFPHGGEAALRQRYAIAATICSGVMIPIGYEFGFCNKLDVQRTHANDWEMPRADITAFVAKVNAAKAGLHILNVDSPPYHVGQDNPQVACLARNHGNERLLICVNQNLYDSQWVRLDVAAALGSARAMDVLRPERQVGGCFNTELAPGEVALIHAA